MAEKGYIGRIPNSGNASAQAPDHSPRRSRQGSFPPLRLLSRRNPPDGWASVWGHGLRAGIY